MKIYLIIIPTIVLVLVVFGIPSPAFFENFITNVGPQNNLGTIPRQAVLLLITVGIIGYLGCRRK